MIPVANGERGHPRKSANFGCFIDERQQQQRSTAVLAHILKNGPTYKDDTACANRLSAVQHGRRHTGTHCSHVAHASFTHAPYGTYPLWRASEDARVDFCQGVGDVNGLGPHNVYRCVVF